MNTKTLKVLCAAILSINLLQSPLPATIINKDSTYALPFNAAAMSAGAVYLGYNFLVRQDYLVSKKAPEAQLWYEAMAEKYPNAHLQTKQFVQKNNQSGYIPEWLATATKKCNLISNYNHIYFTKEALKEITYVYKKVLAGYPLDAKEESAMARYEFILLHEAGHIEHNDSTNILKAVGALTVGLIGANAAAIQMLPEKHPYPVNYKISVPYNVKISQSVIDIQKAEFNICLAPVLSQMAFFSVLVTMLRHQEAQADTFAYKMMDTQTLQKALTLFENDEIDPLFELEKTEYSPYLQSDSTIGNVVQTVVDPIDTLYAMLCKQVGLLIRSTKLTRWAYDYSTDAVHQGPSVRAQNIKNEIARRTLEDNQN